MDIKQIPYLVDMDGTILKPFATDVDWELEEITGSSNRLTVYAPISETSFVRTEMEIIFNSKRYVISEVLRERASAETTIFADEVQVELADRNLKNFQLKSVPLDVCIGMAIANTKWYLGEIFSGSKKYHADFENISAIQALQFLANQSGGRLYFDSLNRKVHMLAPEKDDPQVTFRYNLNMENISKSEVQPTATVMIPIGKDGLTVESVNNKQDYIEDFSWYTAQGIDIKEARKRFTKEYVFEDDRYIYPANLLNDAKKKLAQMSKPQINYIVKASSVDFNALSLDDQVYVVDDELGIKIKTSVVRMKYCKDKTKNELELDYLPASLSVLSQTSLGDSSKSKSETSVFLIKNQNAVVVEAVPAVALSAEITVFTATYFEAGLKLEFECTKEGLLEGYFMMDGVQVGASIKQTVQTGFYTLGIPFLITQVQEGTKFLDLYLKCTGTLKIATEKSELFITTAGAYGGVSNTRPDRRVSENVILTIVDFKPKDNALVVFSPMIKKVIKEDIEFNISSVKPSENVSIFNDAYKTRAEFAQMSNYPEYNTPSQQAVNDFIDTLYASSKEFKVLAIGNEIRVVSHTGKFLLLNLNEGAIVSDASIVGVGAGDQVFSRDKVFKWSDASVSRIKDLETYKK